MRAALPWLGVLILTGLSAGCDLFVDDVGWEGQPCNNDSECQGEAGLVCAGHRCSQPAYCDSEDEIDACDFLNRDPDDAWCTDQNDCDFDERLDRMIFANTECENDAECTPDQFCAQLPAGTHPPFCTFRCLDPTHCPPATESYKEQVNAGADAENALGGFDCVWSPTGPVCADPLWTGDYGVQCHPGDPDPCPAITHDATLQCTPITWTDALDDALPQDGNHSYAYCLEPCGTECSSGRKCCHFETESEYSYDICLPVVDCPSVR